MSSTAQSGFPAGYGEGSEGIGGSPSTAMRPGGTGGRLGLGAASKPQSPVPVPNSKVKNRVVHEEPPKGEAHKPMRPDEYEYILCQVTTNDINAGQNKMEHLKRDGWELHEKIFEGYYKLKRPIKDVMATRKANEQRYVGWMQHTPAADANPGGQHGTSISEQIQADRSHSITAEELVRRAQAGGSSGFDDE